MRLQSSCVIIIKYVGKIEKMEKLKQMKLEIMHAAKEKSELPARELRCYNFDQLIQSLILVVTSKGEGSGGLITFFPYTKGSTYKGFTVYCKK